MLLLPPPPGTCPLCAKNHPPELPHNQQSMYWQYRFYQQVGRWPTWADAVAHCSPAMQCLWRERLEELGAWSEPEGEPIACPPHDAIRQAVGDVRGLGFVSEEVRDDEG